MRADVLFGHERVNYSNYLKKLSKTKINRSKMKKPHLCIPSLLLIISLNITAQVTEINSVEVNSGYNGKRSLTANGKTLYLSSIASGNLADNHTLIREVDNNDSVLWAKLIKNADTTLGLNAGEITNTANGDYLFRGFIAGSSSFVTLSNLDQSFQEKWSKKYSTSTYTTNPYIMEDQDQNLIIGATYDAVSDEDLLVYKLDSNGNVIWGNNYGDDNLDEALFGIYETTDNNYLAIGQNHTSGIVGEIMLLKIDTGGNLLWSKKLGDELYVYGTHKAANGDYIIWGSKYFSASLRTDIFILSIDENGAVNWFNMYQGVGSKDSSPARYLLETADGGFVIPGEYENYVIYGDLSIIKTSGQGALEWFRVFQFATKGSQAYYVYENIDSSLTVFGREQINWTGSNKYQDLKLEIPDGSSFTCENNIDFQAGLSVQTDIFSTSNLTVNNVNVTVNVMAVNVIDTLYAHIDSSICSDTNICSVSSSFSASASSICVNETINFTNSSSGATSYTWKENGLSFSTSTDAAQTFNSAGNYTISLIADSAGCSNSSSIVITVIALPMVSFSGLGSLYCDDDVPVTLVGSPTGGTFTGTGITVNQFYPSAAGVGTYTITYTYTDVNNCTNSFNQSVTVDLPVASFTGLGSTYCDNDAPVSLTGLPTGGTFAGTGITGNQFDPTAAGIGTFVITYTLPAGPGNCSAVDSQSVTVSVCTGIEKAANNTNVQVYPNPFSDQATIRISNYSGETFTFYLYNVLGREVKRVEAIRSNEVTIRRDNLYEGIYFFKITSEKDVVGMGKLVIKN